MTDICRVRLDNRTLANLSHAALGVGAVLALCFVLFSDWRTVLLGASMSMLIAAAFVARCAFRFSSGVIFAIAAIGALYLLSSVLVAFVGPGSKLAVSAAVDIPANAILIALITLLVRQRRGLLSSGDIFDGIIIALGGWMIAWMVFIQPFLGSSEHSDIGLILNAMYLPLSMPLIALATLLLLGSSRPGRATRLAVVGLYLNVLGDIVYALEETRGLGVWAFTAADLLYLAVFVVSAAAMVHPSAREFINPTTGTRRLRLPGRVIATVVALVIPISLLTAIPVANPADRIVRGVSALCLLLLVGARLFQSTRTALHSQDRLIEMALTDDVTGLPNKAAMIEQTDHLINDVWRTDAQPSFFLFDLDRFKNINDSLGHQAGNEVIRVIAHRLQLAATTIGASVARTSGDEFLVLDPTAGSPGEALSHAELLHSVFSEPLTINDGVLFISACVGVASMPIHRPMPTEELFRWADIAMYRAKDAGRNCLALYDQSMQDRVSLRMRVETELHGALDRREFRLFHQPIVEVRSGRVLGFEALIRWFKDDGTMVSPAEFIPVAEETGLIAPIGSWALLEALSQLRTWTIDGIVTRGTTVSVNVSPRQLEDPNFPSIVEEALQRSGVDPHLLWLEVTESMMIDNPELAKSTLRRIRDMGVRIALDDFGTGYSSLSLLQQLPIQRIKIDRAFVNGLTDSAHNQSLIKTIIGLGESMHLDIVAEGVETVEQLKMLRSLGCGSAQGFLISHPVPAEAMRSTIAALESLAAWPEFASTIGGPLSLRRNNDQN
ncbi:MAG: putative bifunctional diguanylate cyclase/phosphodiesterase [Ilumatobacter sp.]|uniref:putative bifunctional diguanylate cyclase/phosphodiesterase n=1 Tax=Ilumatobacter sp. TaxID=1967498 RepID=UPI00391B03B6